MIALDCGGIVGEWFAIYDRPSSSWKTCHTCLPGMGGLGLDQYSEPWPEAGTMLNGECYQLPTSACDKQGAESMLWPTIIGGSELSKVNGRSCLPEHARILLGNLNLSPTECETLMGLPTGWTLAKGSALAPMPLCRKSPLKLSAVPPSDSSGAIE